FAFFQGEEHAGGGAAKGDLQTGSGTFGDEEPLKMATPGRVWGGFVAPIAGRLPADVKGDQSGVEKERLRAERGGEGGGRGRRPGPIFAGAPRERGERVAKHLRVEGV